MRRLDLGPPFDRSVELEYPEGPPSVLVPPLEVLNWRLVSHEVIEGRRPLFGDRRATEERAVAAKMRVQEGLAAVTQGFAQDDSGKWIPPARTAAVESPLVRYRLPLLLGGLIVLIVAAAHFGRRYLQWSAQ